MSSRCALLRSVCLLAVSWLLCARLSLSAVLFVPYNDSECSIPVPSLPIVNLPLYNTSLSYYRCVPFNGVIESFSAQPAAWMWSSCYDTAYTSAGVRIYYYSVGGMCPLDSGKVDVYPPNITYYGSRTNSGLCANMMHTIVSATENRTGSAYTNATCNSLALATPNSAHGSATTAASHLLLTLVVTTAAALIARLATD